jgi:hypothetical protein
MTCLCCCVRLTTVLIHCNARYFNVFAALAKCCTSVDAMDVAHLAEYFKQDKFADVELAIVVPAVTEDPVEDITEPPAKRARLAATDGKVLARFPAHRVVLVGTDYFKAQVGWCHLVSHVQLSLLRMPPATAGKLPCLSCCCLACCLVRCTACC